MHDLDITRGASHRPRHHGRRGLPATALVALATAALATAAVTATSPALAEDGGTSSWQGDRGLVADQRLGLVTPAVAAGTVAAATVTSATSLPAPQSGAEVYPRPSDGVYDVTGGGFGHGIGMSQYGAHGAALAGLTRSQILAFYYPGTSLVRQSPPALTVGLTVDNDGILTVPAREGLAATIGGTTTTLPTGPTLWRVRASGSTANTCTLESYSGSWTGYKSGVICPVRFSTPSGTVDVVLPSDRRVYRGTVSAIWRGSNSVGTANDVPMQSYLRSVVPSEMPQGWAAAALQSQAVAARTYAARGSNGTSWYDTCDTTSCQVYRGAGRRNSDGTFTAFEYPSTDSAVSATDGEVLTFRFSDGATRLATTMYSSSNGGYSAAGGNGHTYLAARSDPYDDVSNNSRHRWSAQLPVTSLESRFGIHRVERVQILSRTGAGAWGGRVLDVRVEGYTSTGTYTYVNTTGNGIMSARSWPAWSTGLSSNYFTLGTQQAPATVGRLSGPNRYATAAAVAARYPTGVSVVYVAYGLDFPDALGGAARAGFNEAPLLLTATASLPPETRDAMVRLRPGRVVVLGSAGVVSDDVANQLAALTTSGNVQRVAGPDRYATAAALAGYYPTGGAVAYVASGENYPDALSGAALAGRDGAPVLLSRADSLPSATADALRRLAPQRIVVLGGPPAVSDGVLAQLRQLATTGTTTRLSGPDRYATAAAIAGQFSSATRAFVASGLDFPDGLTGAAIAARDGAPLLLTRTDALPEDTATALTRLPLADAFVLGGPSVVSDAVKAQVAGTIGN